MPVTRLSVSFDAELARAVRRAAGGESISAWLADAAQRKLRSEGWMRLVREWEREHGPLLDSELAAAERAKRRRRRSLRGYRKIR
jgi:hypothetical protein